MGPGKTIRGYLALCRISNLPSVWTNVLCAAILAAGRFSWGAYLLPALALSCFYLAGMCLNDICDAAHDRIHRPMRPLPAGEVSRPGAIFLTVVLFVAGFALLLAAPCRQGLYAAVLLLAAIVWYDVQHKRNPLSVLLMAACRLLVFVVTALALTGGVPASVWIAGLVQFAYVVCISAVARYENSRSQPFSIPVIPLMLAGISFLDGILLAIFVQPSWLMAGFCGGVLLLAGQRFARGD